ncbi:Arc family DNA-binding protein [Rheinheimera sp. SM2107]|uniref:Arc family DNA-binding protein n=2 Tax=Arsukibacterium indicum TaxID=2848612 RepID=A0ABS6MH46_9GAMM|nr:Arc family DNA-binding protein [Arsukibacterium indicum]
MPRKVTKGLMLRMPPEMHQVVKDIAKEQGRSLNAEMVYRLKQAYAADGVKLAAA